MDAIDDLGDAIDVTRAFLTPVRAGTWLRLALVVFFVTGLGFVGPSVPTADPGVGAEGTEEIEGSTVTIEDPNTGETIEFEITLENVRVALTALVVVGGLLWAIVTLLSSIMEFVLVESLRRDEVRVRRYGGEHLGGAMRLFGFRLVAAAIAFGPLLVVSYRALEGASTVADVDVGALVAVGLATVALAFVHAVVVRLTREFVVPVMVLEGGGVVSGWRRFWAALSANPGEYLVYFVVSWVLGLVAAIAIGIVAGFVGLALAIPVVVLGILLWGAGTGALVALGLVVVAAVALFVLALALVQVPVVCYLRYYALLVLGDTNDRFDLIPERRAAVREGGGRAGPGGDRWDERGEWEGGPDSGDASDDWSDWEDDDRP